MSEKEIPKKRRIFAGYYKRYDGGLHFYVIRVVPDLITGEDVILCRKDSFNDFSYFVLSRKEFDSKVDCGGKKIKKYYRNTRQNPISDKELENIEMDGFPTTIRRTYKEDKMHHTRMARTYEEYAKELLEWYKRDAEACMLTKKSGKIVGMASVETMRFSKSNSSSSFSICHPHFAKYFRASVMIPSTGPTSSCVLINSSAIVATSLWITI